MESKAGTVVAVAGTCVLMGALVGGLTNAVNGAVSPQYFRNIMRWHDVRDIWRASIAQGIFEGLIHGIFFAAVFATVVGVVTRGRCRYLYVARFMLGVAVAVLGCWSLGGIIAMGLAALSPEFYRRAFTGVPEEFGPMLRYAWVGGSILGATFGGLLSAVLGSVIFRIKWKAKLASETVQATL